jgi:hypothetical protein
MQTMPTWGKTRALRLREEMPDHRANVGEFGLLSRNNVRAAELRAVDAGTAKCHINPCVTQIALQKPIWSEAVLVAPGGGFIFYGSSFALPQGPNFILHPLELDMDQVPLQHDSTS